jgi:hypothetical protein
MYIRKGLGITWDAEEPVNKMEFGYVAKYRVKTEAQLEDTLATSNHIPKSRAICILTEECVDPVNRCGSQYKYFLHAHIKAGVSEVQLHSSAFFH